MTNTSTASTIFPRPRLSASFLKPPPTSAPIGSPPGPTPASPRFPTEPANALHLGPRTHRHTSQSRAASPSRRLHSARHRLRTDRTPWPRGNTTRSPSPLRLQKFPRLPRSLQVGHLFP